MPEKRQVRAVEVDGMTEIAVTVVMGVTNEEVRYSGLEFFRIGGADEIFDLSSVAYERRRQREAL